MTFQAQENRPPWIVHFTKEGVLKTLLTGPANNIELLWERDVGPWVAHYVLSRENISPKQIAESVEAYRVWDGPVPQYFRDIKDFWEQEGKQLWRRIQRKKEMKGLDTPDPEAPDDAINPSHYKASASATNAPQLEVADVIEMFGHQNNWYRATALTYLFRAGRKSGQPAARDLQKAIWFIQRELGRLEQEPLIEGRKL